MEKKRAKEKGPYRDKLVPSARKRYLEKLRDIAGLDPYELNSSEWDSNNLTSHPNPTLTTTVV